ncbi:hypothetical protein EC847_103163 [Scandinavium goeteborgense]|uniref:Uncharacterized protein n=1 Tax=Scandinavium goeteborgense TaxID=1851514 RepID=A0A4R6ELX3_SCAGO|nr:hypothetical protein EC847_103163 [Scandinavium goeteborgense]
MHAGSLAEVNTLSYGKKVVKICSPDGPVAVVSLVGLVMKVRIIVQMIVA